MVDHNNFSYMDDGKSHGFDAYLTKPLELLHLQTYLPAILSHVWPRHSTNPTQEEQRLSSDRRTFIRRITLNGRRWYDPLRNNIANNDVDVIVHAGEFVVDNQKKCIHKQGKKLNLSPKEFALLSLLIANQGRVLCPSEIIDKIWHDNNRASEEDVKQYIHLLRKKIEVDTSHPCLIHTVKGYGYLYDDDK